MLDYLRKEIGLLHDSGQFSTSRNYLRTLNSFSSFLENCDIPLTALDSDTACKYEKWLWGRRVSKNSSSFYMRILRAAYNKAVQEQLVEQAFPFHEVYTGIAKTSKRAVSEKTILKLQRLDLSYSRLWLSPGISFFIGWFFESILQGLILKILYIFCEPVFFLLRGSKKAGFFIVYPLSL